MKVKELEERANNIKWIRTFRSSYDLINFCEQNSNTPFLTISHTTSSLNGMYSRLYVINYLRIHELSELINLIKEFIETPIKDRVLIEGNEFDL